MSSLCPALVPIILRAILKPTNSDLRKLSLLGQLFCELIYNQDNRRWSAQIHITLQLLVKIFIVKFSFLAKKIVKQDHYKIQFKDDISTMCILSKTVCHYVVEEIFFFLQIQELNDNKYFNLILNTIELISLVMWAM